MGAARKVILVEDHPEMRAGLRTLLEADGRLEVVAEFGSVADTLSCPELDFAQMVLLDVRLSDGSGVDCALQIRARYPRLPILFLTASTHSVNLEDLDAVGCCKVLSKFLPPDRLLQEVLEGCPA